ncbi:hypothetical protein GCM10010423_65240 [Streptomyces levis]|uniref:Uncharacterized protein n=1 Tax=Streptomyces levis TaxID=285566 RepID=A0ABN3P1A8_9ACTN
MAEDEKKETEKRPTTSRTTQAKKASTADAPREEIKGVIRTSRVGTIEDRSQELDPVGARHKRLAEAPKPGDEEYNPFTDPLIPTSTLQQTVYAELEGLGESPTWKALKENEEREAKKHEAFQNFDEEYARAS